MQLLMYSDPDKLKLVNQIAALTRFVFNMHQKVREHSVAVN